MIKNIILSFIFIILVSCTGSSFSIRKDIESEQLNRDKKIHKKEKKDYIYISKLKDIEIPFEKVKEEIRADENDLIKKRKIEKEESKKKKEVNKLTEKRNRINKYPGFPGIFKVGEYLEFSLQYLGIKAGTGILEIKKKDVLNGKEIIKFKARAYSAAPFSWFYKVDDLIQSYLDIKNIESLRITKRIREGNYSRDDKIDFIQDENKVIKITNNKKPKKVETIEHALDILSAFYMFRTMDLKVGKSYKLPVYDVEKSYFLKVDVVDREVVKVPAGKFRAYKIKPDLKSMGLFKHKGDIFVWISADDKRIPLILKSSIMVGSVYGVLKEYRVKKNG